MLTDTGSYQRHVPRLLSFGAAIVLTGLATRSALHGQMLPVAGIAALALTATAWLAPRFVLLLTAVVMASALLPRAGPFSVAGVRSDVGELLAFLLVGTHVLHLLLTRRAFPRIAWPLLGLVAAAAVGAVGGALRGAMRAEIIGELKAWGLFLLAAVVVSLCGQSRGRRDQLERWLIGYCAIVSGFVLLGAATGLGIPEDAPAAIVITGQEAFNALRLRPAVLPLVYLSLLLILRQCLRNGFRGWRLGCLILFVLMVAASFNRSTWVPLGAAALALIALRPRVRSARARLRGLSRGLTALSLGLAALAAAASGSLGATPQAGVERLNSAFSTQIFEERSYDYRRDENEAAQRALQGHRWTGIGLGQDYGLVRIQTDDLGLPVARPQIYIHNGLLRAWLSTGVLGLGCLGWLAILVTRRSAAAVLHDPQDAAEGSRALVSGLFLAVMGLQGLFNTAMLNRPTQLAIGCALAFLVVDSPHEPGRPGT